MEGKSWSWGWSNEILELERDERLNIMEFIIIAKIGLLRIANTRETRSGCGDRKHAHNSSAASQLPHRCHNKHSTFFALCFLLLLLFISCSVRYTIIHYSPPLSIIHSPSIILNITIIFILARS